MIATAIHPCCAKNKFVGKEVHTMPLMSRGIANVGGDVDEKVQEQLGRIFSIIDSEIEEIAQTAGLSRNGVRLLQPVHCCTLVGDTEVFVVVDPAGVGAIVVYRYADVSGEAMNLPTAIMLAERDLSFQNAFGFTFQRSLLDADEQNQRAEATRIAGRYINDELAELERQSRIVRINPIFQGREFLVDEGLAFVLSPFAEPFDTIYEDHLKPSVESAGDLRCLRADDIYDNRPIMEDIWKSINEAKIIISDLTGKNPNVFYETGIAHTIGKEVVLVTQSMADVPFDLRHLRCIVYEYVPRGMTTFEQNLKNTVLNILARRGWRSL